MGLVKVDWASEFNVLGLDGPVAWILEAGLIYLTEKEAKQNEASKPIDLDSLPF